MNANSIIAVGYLRLSREEATAGESSSIKTQRTMITDYCNRQGINIVRFYADDGWSGSNFNRPGFQEMMQELENGIVNTVITKDLSRLGRDMRESSYYPNADNDLFPEIGKRSFCLPGLLGKSLKPFPCRLHSCAISAKSLPREK